MKKFLLSIAAVTMTASMALADHTVIDFLGTGDCYGLTRQTTTRRDLLEYNRNLSFEQDGVNFSLTTSVVTLFGETGQGVALVNAGTNKEGLILDRATDFEITLSVPNGTISKALVAMNGYAIQSLALDVNGTPVEGNIVNFPVVQYLWESENPVESLTIKIPNSYGERYIREIELTYQPDLGGKLPSGLEFPVIEADAILDEIPSYPVLANPHNLPVTWTSSDEEVATIDPTTGEITMVNGGKTVITATTEGNDQYGEGTARYTLTIIPVASNIPELELYAPVLKDRVKVNFPLIVTFGNGNFAFVKDEENNVSMIYDTRNDASTTATATIYHKGDVIPAGWIARNNNERQSPEWKGLPGDPTEVVDVVYPEVTSVTPADNNRVVILKQVEFTTRTPGGNERRYGKTPDGTTYRFEDTYNIGEKAPGCYNVTCVVRYAVLSGTTYFWLAPIAYEIYEPSAVGTIDSENAAPRYFNLQGVEVAEPADGLYIKQTNGRSEKVIVK